MLRFPLTSHTKECYLIDVSSVFPQCCCYYCNCCLIVTNKVFLLNIADPHRWALLMTGFATFCVFQQRLPSQVFCPNHLQIKRNRKQVSWKIIDWRQFFIRISFCNRSEGSHRAVAVVQLPSQWCSFASQIPYPAQAAHRKSITARLLMCNEFCITTSRLMDGRMEDGEMKLETSSSESDI